MRSVDDLRDNVDAILSAIYWYLEGPCAGCNPNKNPRELSKLSGKELYRLFVHLAAVSKILSLR